MDDDTDKFDELFDDFSIMFEQCWNLSYFSIVEGLRKLVLCWHGQEVPKFIDKLYEFLALECPEEEKKSLYNSLLENIERDTMNPKKTLERLYNIICSIAVQELGLKIDHEYVFIPMPSPIVDYPVDYELQEKYKREYPLIYQTIQDCLVEDCILKEKQSYGQKVFLYCRQYYEVEAEEGLKEAQRLKEEKHSDEEWKKIFYTGFGMRYNLDYYELSSERMLWQIEEWFKSRIEDFEVMRKCGGTWDKEKMKPNRRKVDV